MDMAVVNAYILYRKSVGIQNKKKMSHYRFRLGIIKQLVKPFFLTKKKLTDLFEFDESKDDFCLRNRKLKY